MFQSLFFFFFFLDLGDGRIPSRGDSAAAPAVGDGERSAAYCAQQNWGADLGGLLALRPPEKDDQCSVGGHAQTVSSSSFITPHSNTNDRFLL